MRLAESSGGVWPSGGESLPDAPDQEPPLPEEAWFRSNGPDNPGQIDADFGHEWSRFRNVAVRRLPDHLIDKNLAVARL